MIWLLLCLQVARLLWILFAPAETTAAPASAPTIAADSTTRLPSVDLFYRQSNRRQGAASLEVHGYRLFGLRTGQAGASAILGKDGKQRAYPEGGQLEAGVRLEEVAQDHVWLTANDGRHRLDLPPMEMKRSASRSAGSIPATTHPIPATPATAPPSTAATPPPASAKSQAPVGGISAGQLLEAGMAGTSGELAARIPGGRTALMKLAGLREDDVVLSVDGQPVDASKLGALGNTMAGRSQVTVQYRRDGRIHTTTLNAPR